MLSFCLFTAILMTFFVILSVIFIFIHIDDSAVCGFLITGILVGYLFWMMYSFSVINDNFDVTVKIKQSEMEEMDTGRK